MKKVVISLHISIEQRAKLRALAAQDGKSMSDIVRTLIEAAQLRPAGGSDEDSNR